MAEDYELHDGRMKMVVQDGEVSLVPNEDHKPDRNHSQITSMIIGVVVAMVFMVMTYRLTMKTIDKSDTAQYEYIDRNVNKSITGPGPAGEHVVSDTTVHILADGHTVAGMVIFTYDTTMVDLRPSGRRYIFDTKSNGFHRPSLSNSYN